jgi:3-isopropylmalate dehydrogenase
MKNPISNEARKRANHVTMEAPSEPPHRWSACVPPPGSSVRERSLLIGILAGEGVGPELTGCAVDLLHTIERNTGQTFEIEHGGPIGREAEALHGAPLSEEVVDFCRSIFARGGAILNGPGGGRYVYDLRKRFDLFFKISPLKPSPELRGACHLKHATIEGADILLLRENVSGIYQGRSTAGRSADGGRFVVHEFQDREDIVRRFLAAASRLARMRSGPLTVVSKEAGLPQLSALWRRIAEEEASANGIRCDMIDIDHMAYRLIQHPREFDVIAAPNLCGDVLADLGAVLLGSRGNSYSGNFSPAGHAVYQTNHGAAHDLAGHDRANPAGQIFSLAMLLRESFGLISEASWIGDAVSSAWASGWRTADVDEPGCKTVGTRDFARLVSERLDQIARRQAAVPCLA